MRIFVALHLEAGTLEPVRALQARLSAADSRHQVRWVDPAGMHLTLQFLGETEERRADRVREGIATAIRGLRAPQLGLSGVGGFPNLRRPRVLWVGLREEGQALAHLHAAVEAATEALGWERERRPFQPHLTLGRSKEPPGGRTAELAPELARALQDAGNLGGAVQSQPRLALVRSHLGPGGARYEDLAAWELER
jgi:RNA 2',3'-cyclic 3'-phosphodiesterase